MDEITMIKEILKKLKSESDRIDNKLLSGYYSVNESRCRYAEVSECIDDVLEVAEKKFTQEDIRQIIKECL